MVVCVLVLELGDDLAQPWLFSEHSEGEELVDVSLGSGVKMRMGVVVVVVAVDDCSCRTLL